MRFLICRPCCALLFFCLLVPFLPAQADRRERTEPGLMLTTSGRLGACDALMFTKDGQHLLATGDDKIVMQWTLSPRRELEPARVPCLRWGIWREQRGAIYAMALSPDQDQRYVAVGGLGLKNGMLAVLDRLTGETYQALTEIRGKSSHTVWSVTFSPNGKQVAYGGDDGSVWLWSLDKNFSVELGRHAPKPGERFNFVKLVAFVGEDRLLSVAKNGQVFQWDLSAEKPEPKELFRFEVPEIVMAIRSPDGRWLAAAADGYRRIEVRSLDGTEVRRWDVPEGEYPHSLAFHPQSTTLAVGTRIVDIKGTFFKELGGKVRLYNVRDQEAAPVDGPSVNLRAERLAFHPSGEMLAIAGGDDQEVTLWNLQGNSPQLLHTVRSQGRAIWGITISPEGRFLGFRQEKEPNPPAPNRRAKDIPWRVYDLHTRKFVTASTLKQGLEPIDRLAGWSVEPDRSQVYDWYVVGPNQQRHKIPWNPALDNVPQCWSFLPGRPGQPVRLAIGHYWGVSIFELGEGPPRKVRNLVGHQGEVTCLVPSQDGRMLYSGSRDQTIAAWSLMDWPVHPEMGVRFVLRNEGLVVDSVDSGSPGWEAGLSVGDQVTRFAYAGKENKEGPESWLKVLRSPEPGKECYFEVKRAGQLKPVPMLTTNRQRPLWRYFPTTSGEWVLWRWRDYYYDCSTNGDFFVGWHVNGELNETPAFYRAEQFRRRFHRPDKVAELVTKGIVEPERVAFADYEPPQVRVVTSRPVVRDDDLTVKLSVKPRGDGDNLQPEKVLVWVNDFLFDAWASTNPGSQERTITVPRAKLRRGTNVVVAQCYNKAGGRGEANRAFVELAAAPEQPKLFGVFVGVGNYQKAKPQQATLSADIDAQGLYEAWKAQKGSLYADNEMHLLLNDKATPEAILQQLQTLTAKAGPDDRLVISLGGHGVSTDELTAFLQKAKLEGVDSLPPQSFAFAGPFFDAQRPNKTGLTSRDLYDAIIHLPCRKVILLYACHSGTIGVSPVRELTRDGIGPVILAACSPEESAIEFSEADDLKRANGLFTLAIIKALNEDFGEADADHNQVIDARELSSYIPGKVVKMVAQLRKEQIKGLETRRQNPQVFPPFEAERVALVGK